MKELSLVFCVIFLFFTVFYLGFQSALISCNKKVYNKVDRYISCRSNPPTNQKCDLARDLIANDI